MSTMNRKQFIIEITGTAVLLSLDIFPHFLLGQKANDGLPKEVSRYIKLIYNNSLMGNMGSGGPSQNYSPIRRRMLGLPREVPNEKTGEIGSNVRKKHAKRFSHCFGNGLNFGDIFVSAASGSNVARLSINNNGEMYVFEFDGIGKEYIGRIAEASAKTDYLTADELLMGFEAVINLDRESFGLVDDGYVEGMTKKDRKQRPKSWMLIKDSERDGLNVGDNDFAMTVHRGRYPSLTPDPVINGGEIASFGTYHLNRAVTGDLNPEELALLHDHVTKRYETILGYSLSQLKETYSMMRRLGK